MSCCMTSRKSLESKYACGGCLRKEKGGKVNWKRGHMKKRERILYEHVLHFISPQSGKKVMRGREEEELEVEVTLKSEAKMNMPSY